MSLRQLSIEPTELIALPEAYRQMYIVNGSESPDDTAIATSLIESARLSCENYTWRQLLEAQYEYRLDEFPEIIEVPKPPCISIDSVKYVNTSGTLVTLDSSLYQTSIYSEPARIKPVNTWPETKDQMDAVIVTFTCGYNDEETPSLPEDLKTGMLMLIKYLFDNRDTVAVSEGKSLDIEELPFGTRHMWGSYSVRVPV